MSLKRSLILRLHTMSRTTSRQRHYPMIRPPNLRPNRSAMDPDPGDNNALARPSIQRREAAFPPELQPMQENIMKRLGLSGRISSSDGDLGRNFLIWSPSPTPNDVRKLLRVAQMEMAKERLREMPEAWLEYEEFVRVCGCGFSDPGRGVRVAKMLDESGHVVVLGDHVLLRPELVRKAIEGLMPINDAIGTNDRMRKELEDMQKEKMVIDAIAVSQVKRELWCGLGFLVAQTTAFMRLTFWELTWDVMEPICFYLTSMYFMAGYTFFLRTSREPSFEGFFQSRIETKRKRLMDARGFDLRRYEELLRVCSSGYSAESPHMPISICGSKDNKVDSFCKRWLGRE